MIFIILFIFVINTIANSSENEEIKSTLKELLKEDVSYSLYSINKAFEAIETIKLDKQIKQTVLKWMKDIMEAYAFKDILKNPP